MLTITVPAVELWDDNKQEFVYGEEQTLRLEHSLLSLSKWESKWHKAYLGGQEKTHEETIDYIKCMTLTSNVKPEVYSRLSPQNIQEIIDYINDPMTATTFYDDKPSGMNRETVTSELIYYWMISLQIPVDFEKWHLNRLMTLIRVCNVKNAPPKKMSKGEIMRRNAALNAQRKAKYNTRG